jgi:phosphotriesterase-related protein
VSGRFRVRTAAGDRVLDPDAGYTLPHEHLVCDLRARWWGEGDAWALDPPGSRVAMEALDELRHRPQATIRENLVLSDWYLAATELRHVRDTGGGLVVDVTVEGLFPEPRLSRRAAELAGLHAVVALGRYLPASLSPAERDEPVESLVDRWTGQAENGVDGCAIGVIGELGVGPDLSDVERRTLVAGGRVAVATGLAVNVHVEPGSSRVHEALDILAETGADLGRVAVSHVDAAPDTAALARLLDRGCYAEFDLFGRAPAYRFGGRYSADDETRVDVLCELADRGYADRLLLSQDICMRHALLHYGGYGYAHLARHVLPVLTERLGAAAVRQMTCVNPLRFLAVD